MSAVGAPEKSNEIEAWWPFESRRDDGRHRSFGNRTRRGRKRRCVEGRQQGRRRDGANAATCAGGALCVRQERFLRASFAAVLAVGLLGELMVLVTSRDHRFIPSRLGLRDRHRSAALEGQHGDRKPKEKAEEQAHDPNMVPQTKRMHQGTVVST